MIASLRRPPARLLPLLLCALAACGEAAVPVPECLVASSCPAPTARCEAATCLANTCGIAPLPAGTVVDPSPYCARIVCDGAGSEVLQSYPPNCVTAAPTITGASPAYVSVAGGPALTVSGANLQGAVVTLGGAYCTAAATDDGTSMVLTPPDHLRASTQNELSVTNRLGTSIVDGWFPSVYELVPGLTPLVADGSASDWDPRYQAAVLGNGSNPASLHILSVAWDEQALWLAILGGQALLPANALVVYIDAQYGPAPHAGVSDLATLTDVTGALDDACASSLVISDPSFRAQFCAGSVGLAAVALGQGLPATDAAGLRLLANLADPSALDWGVDGAGGSTIAVATGTDVVDTVPTAVTEFQIPWSALGLTGAPHGSTVGLFVRAVSPAGTPVAGQALPSDSTKPPGVSKILQVQVP